MNENENVNNEVVNFGENGEVVDQIEVDDNNKAAVIALAATGIGGLIAVSIILTKKVIIPAIRRHKEKKFATIRSYEDDGFEEEEVEK